MASLQNLKIGDTIAVHATRSIGDLTSTSFKFYTIKRETATTFEGQRGMSRVSFRKSDGRSIGSSSHVPFYGMPATQEMLDKVAAERDIGGRWIKATNAVLPLRKALEGRTTLSLTQMEALAQAWESIASME